LRYEFKFKWRGGTPVDPPESQSSFNMGNSVRGAPTDAELQPALSALSATQSPLANDQAKMALRTVRIPPNANRSDNPEWFNNVPLDFFQ
jgi:hypothetical protein